MKTFKLTDIHIGRKQWLENFYFYYRWHVVGIVAGVALVVSFIVSVATRVDPDVNLAVIGKFPLFSVNQEAFEQALAERCPELAAIGYDSAIDPVGDGDAQMMMAVAQKKQILASVADVDLFICDSEFFAQMSGNELFMEFRDIIALMEQGGVAAAGIALDEAQKAYDGGKWCGVRLRKGSALYDLLGGVYTAEGSPDSEEDVVVCMPVYAKNPGQAARVMGAFLEDSYG